jgi:two-component system chemotaxis response regulator CheY
MSDPNATAAASVLTAARPADQRLRVLIADDTPAIRAILMRMVRQSVDALQLEARNGHEAVREYRAKQPNLVFLDIDMPGSDGLDALEEIRGLDPRAYVVMVSGHSSLEKVQQAVALGAEGFVVKPFSSRRIAEVLRKFERATKHAGRTHGGGPG